MNERPVSNGDSIRLPKEIFDRFRRPFDRFLRVETTGGIVLLFSTLVALILSNSPWADSFLSLWEIDVGFRIDDWVFERSLKEWINDGLMTLFFFLVSMELKRELILGELRKPRLAILPISAALGGMLVPAGIYVLLQSGQSGQHGWGVVMATDTAFVVGCLALLGARAPKSLRVFMLALAIVDDLGAVLVVAIGYSSDIIWPALVVAIFGFAIVRLMAFLGIRGFSIYFLVGGFIWIAVDASGIHATVSGVILGLMTPTRRWVSDERLHAILGQVIAHPISNLAGSGDTKDRQTLQVAEVAARETLSPLERLEILLHPWIGLLIMPLFALANAGVPLSMDNLGSSVMVAILVGFVIGKPIGILSFSYFAVRSGTAVLPPDLSWRALTGGSLLAGIGFTMALFIANLAFGEDLIDGAKMSILLASVVSAILGITLLAGTTLPTKNTI